jgi:hypothetical protein
MQHVISSYRDGYQSIDYCLNCGKEGLALYSECLGGNPSKIICGQCGQANLPSKLPCKNCENIRLKFLTLSQNFPKSHSLNNLFNINAKRS